MEIEFNNVSFVINEKTHLEKTILKDVSFKIKECGIYGFLGNSNSGKTVCGGLINGVIRPTKGFVKVNDFINDGRRIKNINALRMSVGYVYKNKSDMFFNNTVKQELEFGIKYFKYKTEKKAVRSVDALKIVGLDETYLSKKIDSLSLSETKKVSIACVLVFNPKIIILDEISIGLNYKEKKELSRIIKLMREKYNKTIILLSKDTEFLFNLVEYVYVFNKARLVRSGDNSILRDVEFLESYKFLTPGIVKFIELANKKKNVKLEEYSDIKDLIKGVYRNVF